MTWKSCETHHNVPPLLVTKRVNKVILPTGGRPYSSELAETSYRKVADDAEDKAI